MNWIYIVLSILVFVIGGLTAYFSTKSSITSMVSYLIAQAENTDLNGSEKMKYVVAKLYENVPSVFKSILTEEALEEIAQKVFDAMKEYAISWANKQDSEDE